MPSGPACLCSPQTYQGQAHTRQGAGLLSRYQGQVSLLLQVVRAKGQEGISLLSLPTHGRALPCSYPLSQPTSNSKMFRAFSPRYYSWLGAGAALLFSCPKGHLSHDIQMRDEASSAQPSDISMSPCSNPYQEHQPGLWWKQTLLLQDHGHIWP